MDSSFKFDFDKFVWKPAGYREMNNSPAVKSELLSRANRIKSSAESMGGTYVADVQSGRRLAHAIVKTGGYKAKLANAKHNALEKARNAGR